MHSIPRAAQHRQINQMTTEITASARAVEISAGSPETFDKKDKMYIYNII